MMTMMMMKLPILAGAEKNRSL